MAHLIIEYPQTLATDPSIEALCRTAYQAMCATGTFPLAGVRVRAYSADHAIIADDHPENAFVAMTLSVGAGRSTETLKAAGEAIFAAAQEALSERLAGQHFALSLEIRQIDPALSWKDTPIHKRLNSG